MLLVRQLQFAWLLAAILIPSCPKRRSAGRAYVGGCGLVRSLTMKLNRSEPTDGTTVKVQLSRWNKSFCFAGFWAKWSATKSKLGRSADIMTLSGIWKILSALYWGERDRHHGAQEWHTSLWYNYSSTLVAMISSLIRQFCSSLIDSPGCILIYWYCLLYHMMLRWILPWTRT